MTYIFLMGALYAIAAVVLGLATAYLPMQDRPARQPMVLAARYAGALAIVAMCVEIWLRYGWICSVGIGSIAVIAFFGFFLLQYHVFRYSVECAAHISELRSMKLELEDKLEKSQSETRKLRKRVSTQPMLDPTP